MDLPPKPVIKTASKEGIHYGSASTPYKTMVPFYGPEKAAIGGQSFFEKHEAPSQDDF